MKLAVLQTHWHIVALLESPMMLPVFEVLVTQSRLVPCLPKACSWFLFLGGFVFPHTPSPDHEMAAAILLLRQSFLLVGGKRSLWKDHEPFHQFVLSAADLPANSAFEMAVLLAPSNLRPDSMAPTRDM